MERLPPQNIEAEAAVLGSILIDPQALTVVAEMLRPEDFYRDSHRLIFQACRELYTYGRPADLVTLTDELERRGQMDKIGGVDYVTALVNTVPTSANVEYYAQIVERAAILRKLITVAGQIAALAYAEPNASAALDKAEQLVFSIGQRVTRADFEHIRDILDTYYDKLEHLHDHRGDVVGIPTGFTDFDKMTGGLQRSDLIILAARPAVGKCLTAQTLIDDPATGARLTIEACYQRQLQSVFGLSDTGKVRPTAITNWIDSGVKPCYRVQTATGRVVEVTGHHPFLTARGWVPLHDLSVGDAIAVPVAVPAFGTDESWPIESVRLLADTVAEGQAFPAVVWTWSRRQLAEFLHMVMRHSGSITHENGRPCIALTTTASTLAHDMHHAFIRFGLTTTLSHTAQDVWHVEITEARSIQRYQDVIGWFGEQREQPANHITMTALHGSRAEQHTTGGHLAGAAVLDEPRLAVAASDDIAWDTITSIDAIGNHQVYDLTVPDGANFIAQDIFVHNTALALSLAHNAAIRFQQSIAIFSLEMSKEQLAQRLLSMDAGVDQQRLRTGYISDVDDEWSKISLSIGRLSDSSIYIDDMPGISLLEMRSKARRLMTEHPFDLMIVDYLQLMQGTGSKGDGNRQQEISEISRGLKILARELNIPILALSQLSRAVESRQSKVPMLSDLRESGSIEQDADIVLFIYRDDVYNPETDRPNIADIIVAKHRNGPVGTFSLYFQNSQTRFRDLELQRASDM